MANLNNDAILKAYEVYLDTKDDILNETARLVRLNVDDKIDTIGGTITFDTIEQYINHAIESKSVLSMTLLYHSTDDVGVVVKTVELWETTDESVVAMYKFNQL